MKSISSLILGLFTASALAMPNYLVTHNETDLESNAFVAGTVPSPYPTAAHSSRQVFWNMVRLACFGHIVDNKCTALIKMGTDTPVPIDVGYLTLDLLTGDITPKQISNNGFVVSIDGLGECRISRE